MRQRLIYVLCFIAGSIVVAFIVARLTGALQLYTIPTTANKPTIQPGELFFATNLKGIEKGEFTAFNWRDGKYFFRLMAAGGDVMEVRDGVCYVNGRNADEGRNLSFMYWMPTEEANYAVAQELVEKDEIRFMGVDSSLVILDTALASSLGVRGNRHVVKKDDMDAYISEQYGQPWNQDHFGPYKVPEGKLFFLGDSRHNAMDSRYMGAIDEAEWVGTKL